MTKNEIILKITGRGFNIHQSWHIEPITLICTLRAYEENRKGKMFTINHRLGILDRVFSKDSEYIMNKIENQLFEALFEKMKEEGVL